MGNTAVDGIGSIPSEQSKDIRQSLEPVIRSKNSKIITVIVDEDIQFEVDVTDPKREKSCGWLLAEVTRKYTIVLAGLQNRGFQTKNAQQQMQGNGHDVRMPRHKRRYIVALKTQEGKEGIDTWLNQYERNLTVLKDGTILTAHFARLGQPDGTSLLQKREISIQDFEQMRVIGRGGFSRVILARKKDTGRLYAIKILRKDQLTNENALKPVMRERQVLEMIDHPFIIKLHWAFQSSKEMFFVMDICSGGELFYHLLQHRRFSEKQAKFFFCEILLGFQYLHEQDIVFRDIKPENILVDMDGHIRIADFGLSKIIPENEHSYSFCGSPEYLCPEMLQSDEGHDRRVDIYCLGVLLYEMFTGLPPYYDEDNNIMFEKIMNSDLTVNQAYLSSEVKSLLITLLERDPVMRFQSIEEIMQHSWFKDVNWFNLLNKNVKPPLVPDIDSCYFENDDHDESRDSVFNISGLRPSMHRSNQRRQSYYLQSTMMNSSQIDERSSFVGPNSRMRQIFDSSAILTNLNESLLLQNLQTSVLEGKNLVNASHLQQHLLQQNNVSDILNISQVDQVLPPHALNNIPNFNYSSPPLAETQILRHLEAHINRKKKDQLDKARRFREKLVQRKQEGIRKFKEDQNQQIVPAQPAQPTHAQNQAQPTRFSPLKSLLALKQKSSSNRFLLERDNNQQHKFGQTNIKSSIFSQSSLASRPQLVGAQTDASSPVKMLGSNQKQASQQQNAFHVFQDNNKMLSLSNQVFSDSEVVIRQKHSMNKELEIANKALNHKTMNEHQRDIDEQQTVVNQQDESQVLQNVIAEIPSGYLQLNQSNEKYEDLQDSFRSEHLQQISPYADQHCEKGHFSREQEKKLSFNSQILGETIVKNHSTTQWDFQNFTNQKLKEEETSNSSDLRSSVPSSQEKSEQLVQLHRQKFVSEEFASLQKGLSKVQKRDSSDTRNNTPHDHLTGNQTLNGKACQDRNEETLYDCDEHGDNSPAVAIYNKKRTQPMQKKGKISTKSLEMIRNKGFDQKHLVKDTQSLRSSSCLKYHSQQSVKQDADSKQKLNRDTERMKSKEQDDHSNLKLKAYEYVQVSDILSQFSPNFTGYHDNYILARTSEQLNKAGDKVTPKYSSVESESGFVTFGAKNKGQQATQSDVNFREQKALYAQTLDNSQRSQSIGSGKLQVNQSESQMELNLAELYRGETNTEISKKDFQHKKAPSLDQNQFSLTGKKLKNNLKNMKFSIDMPDCSSNKTSPSKIYEHRRTVQPFNKKSLMEQDSSSQRGQVQYVKSKPLKPVIIINYQNDKKCKINSPATLSNKVKKAVDKLNTNGQLPRIVQDTKKKLDTQKKPSSSSITPIVQISKFYKSQATIKKTINVAKLSSSLSGSQTGSEEMIVADETEEILPKSSFISTDIATRFKKIDELAGKTSVQSYQQKQHSVILENQAPTNFLSPQLILKNQVGQENQRSSFQSKNSQGLNHSRSFAKQVRPTYKRVEKGMKSVSPQRSVMSIMQQKNNNDTQSFGKSLNRGRQGILNSQQSRKTSQKGNQNIYSSSVQLGFQPSKEFLLRPPVQTPKFKQKSSNSQSKQKQNSQQLTQPQWQMKQNNEIKVFKRPTGNVNSDLEQINVYVASKQVKTPLAGLSVEKTLQTSKTSQNINLGNARLHQTFNKKQSSIMSRKMGSSASKMSSKSVNNQQKKKKVDTQRQAFDQLKVPSRKESRNISNSPKRNFDAVQIRSQEHMHSKKRQEENLDLRQSQQPLSNHFKTLIKQQMPQPQQQPMMIQRVFTQSYSTKTKTQKDQETTSQQYQSIHSSQYNQEIHQEWLSSADAHQLSKKNEAVQLSPATQFENSEHQYLSSNQLSIKISRHPQNVKAKGLNGRAVLKKQSANEAPYQSCKQRIIKPSSVPPAHGGTGRVIQSQRDKKSFQPDKLQPGQMTPLKFNIISKP